MSDFPKIQKTDDLPPEIHMAGIVSEGQSGYIEGMEAKGQAQFVNSTLLPTDLGVSRTTEADYEAMGIVFGPVDEDDPMFRQATLPEGWSKQPSDHSMWSHVLDDRGIKRIAVFYKAAFYDRSAHMGITRPGAELVSDIIYGDEPVALTASHPIWSVFTEDERAQFVDALEDMMKNIREHPNIYKNRIERTESLYSDATRLLELDDDLGLTPKLLGHDG